MGTSLNNTKIKDTFQGLIKTTDNSTVGSSNKELTDGSGNDLNISVNNTGAITADGNITAANLIKSGGTSTQILLATGAVVTLTLESAGISSNDNDTSVPTNASVKDFVDTEIANLVDSSPAALNTLNELAAALGDDANFSTTVNTALGNRLRIDVNNQGLSATQKTNALTNLGITSTPAEVNILDGATLSTAELNFVDGVTSNIQTQINGLQSQITGGATTITDSDLTASRALVSDSSGKVSASNVTSAEVDFLDGVTSNIQTQLDAKTDTTYTTSAVDSGDDAIIRLTGSDSTNEDVTLVAGSNITITPSGDNITIASTAAGNTFNNVAVSGQSNIVADSSTDTLNFSAGDNITLTTNASTDTLTIASTASGGGDSVTVEKNTFTATAAQEDFTITSAPDSVNNLQIYLDGVYQAKANYTVSGTTVTINTGTGIEVGVIVEIIHLKVVKAKLLLQSHTANGTDTTFSAGGNITNENQTQVYIDGVYQSKDAYTVSGANIDFGTGNAPHNGAIVEILHIKAGSGAGVSWDSTAKTADFTADANEGYFVDTSSAAITVTMPSSPSVGDTVHLIDYGANAATNNIKITSSDDIDNSSNDSVINYDKAGVELIYSGSTKGWLVASAANETASAISEDGFDLDFLVVAGGGGGGSNSTIGAGGGGAGGLRTSFGSTSGGGATAETSLRVFKSTSYTVSVGGGGSVNANGGDSTFSTITSAGGGRGGYRTGSETGANGGSGGGSASISGESGGSGTSGQGFDGGTGFQGANFSATYRAGGGGGATEAGNTDGQSEGGDGLSSSITGSSVVYAGGGGGNQGTSYGTASGGAGGGGAANSSGSSNTGGGGGGNAAGGSGVVILRYPNTFTLSETTSPTVLTFSTSTDGSDKVTTFTAGSNGTIQFS